MRRIGIRELRRNAGRYLRDVKRGETIEVTDRRRPVARLVPLSSDGDIEDPVASGRLAPATGDALELGPPLLPTAGEALPSEALGRARPDAR